MLQVAMLFLTPGDMPLEPVWATWLAAADRLIPTAYASIPGDRVIETKKRSEMYPGPEPGNGREAYQRQELFSLYVHTPPGHPGFPADSVFFGRDIPKRAKVGNPTETILSPHSPPC